MKFFGCNVNELKYVSMNNVECRVSPEIINSNEPLFYPYVFLMLIKT